MRSNPKYSNICWVRIGMYKDWQCYNCQNLIECDKYYNKDTGEFDYLIPTFPNEVRRRNGGAKIKLRSNNADI